ncbi:MAG: hypothetical protein H5T82_05185 [Demequina sp.]|uniref:hypothetical protein n=1 Tax=Demequina sp. TaxID=2050685 RepID=UPI0019C17828|nr:hypothetical protein [Demequina sp.]MBC7298270.1 hypothetical protein [Demequina sp.]
MSQQLRMVATARLGASTLVLFALALTLTDTSGLVPARVIDLLGYDTLQANVIALAVWVALTFAAARPTSAKVQRALEYARAFAIANLVLVAILYWVMIAPLGLEAGPQLATVMVISHIVTPVYATIDYLVVGPAEPLPMRGWRGFFAVPTVWVSRGHGAHLRGRLGAVQLLGPGARAAGNRRHRVAARLPARGIGRRCAPDPSAAERAPLPAGRG